ncbi:hypothetical protein L204_100482 [Cryptococcus depauperatus]|nr:hypothetical protein L204_06378 [Cryptococcus depauperatus CBS 7855]
MSLPGNLGSILHSSASQPNPQTSSMGSTSTLRRAMDGLRRRANSWTPSLSSLPSWMRFPSKEPPGPYPELTHTNSIGTQEASNGPAPLTTPSSAPVTWQASTPLPNSTLSASGGSGPPGRPPNVVKVPAQSSAGDGTYGVKVTKTKTGKTGFYFDMDKLPEELELPITFTTNGEDGKEEWVTVSRLKNGTTVLGINEPPEDTLAATHLRQPPAGTARDDGSAPNVTSRPNPVPPPTDPSSARVPSLPELAAIDAERFPWTFNNNYDSSVAMPKPGQVPDYSNGKVNTYQFCSSIAQGRPLGNAMSILQGMTTAVRHKFLNQDDQPCLSRDAAERVAADIIIQGEPRDEQDVIRMQDHVLESVNAEWQKEEGYVPGQSFYYGSSPLPSIVDLGKKNRMFAWNGRPLDRWLTEKTANISSSRPRHEVEEELWESVMEAGRIMCKRWKLDPDAAEEASMFGTMIVDETIKALKDGKKINEKTYDQADELISKMSHLIHNVDDSVRDAFFDNNVDATSEYVEWPQLQKSQQFSPQSDFESYIRGNARELISLLSSQPQSDFESYIVEEARRLSRLWSDNS